MKMRKPRTYIEGWGPMPPRRRLKLLRHGVRGAKMIGRMHHWRFYAVLQIFPWAPLWRSEWSRPYPLPSHCKEMEPK